MANELALNALKHGYGGRDGGCISFKLEEDGDARFRLQVADSGSGLPDDFDWRAEAAWGSGSFPRLFAPWWIHRQPDENWPPVHDLDSDRLTPIRRRYSASATP